MPNLQQFQVLQNSACTALLLAGNELLGHMHKDMDILTLKYDRDLHIAMAVINRSEIRIVVSLNSLKNARKKYLKR